MGTTLNLTRSMSLRQSSSLGAGTGLRDSLKLQDCPNDAEFELSANFFVGPGSLRTALDLVLTTACGTPRKYRF